MYPVSDQFMQAVGTTHKAVSRVDVWNGDTYLATLPTITAGGVSVDETRAVRRQLTLTVVSQGVDVDAWVPVLATDLLHPSSGNELRPYRGVDYQDGSDPELVPLGVFRMSQPTIDDTGDSLTIALTGNDRSSWVSRIKWQAPYVIAKNTNLATAVQALINNRIPGLTYNFAPTTATVPATTFGTDITGTNDPWADASSLAATGGMELLFDVLGQVVMRPVADPTTGPIVATWTDQEPADGVYRTLTEVQRVLDETVEYNGAICIGNGSAGAPVQAAVWDTDPASPTYYLGPWGQVPYIFETSAIPGPGQNHTQATASALAAAQAQFQLVRRAFDGTTFTAVPHPALAEGDCLGLVRTRMGVDGEYVASQLNIPLDVGSSMSVTNRPREQAA